MMENCKRRLVSCAEEDRNNLPEHLLIPILERVPVQDAVRTSILSKSWRYRWTKMGALLFDKQFSNKFAKNGAFGHNGFIRIINRVLFLHKGPILKFHLHIPNIFLDSFEEVDQWMLLLSRSGVRELILTNLNQRYELPCYVFSCLELTKLKLENCFFKLPPKFEGFFNLEDLFLGNIEFGANLCGTQISLPNLKKLVLSWCTNIHNFNIKATRLYNLGVFMTCPAAMLLGLLRSPCLSVLCMCFRKPTEDNIVRVEGMTPAMMLSNLTKVENFRTNDHFLKFITAEYTPKWLAHPLISLRHLWFHNFQLGDLDQLQGALCMLRNSPNLEKLDMIQLEMEAQVDVGPALNHFESPNCLDCTFHQLHTVEMTSLEGTKPELLFIKLLLAHSPSLERFTITPSGASDLQKRFDIAKDVMSFPRASPKAVIIYLNPETNLHCYLAL